MISKAKQEPRGVREGAAHLGGAGLLGLRVKGSLQGGLAVASGGEGGGVLAQSCPQPRRFIIISHRDRRHSRGRSSCWSMACNTGTESVQEHEQGSCNRASDAKSTQQF